MAFFWVRQWVPLPVVYHQQMGDPPPGPRPQAMDHATSAFAPAALKSPDSNAPFYSQLSALPQGQLRPDFRPPAHSTGHYQSQDHGASSMNMGAMASALPDFGADDDASLNHQNVPRSLSGASASAVAYQLGQNLQMSSHPSYGPGFAAGMHQQPFMPQHGPQYGAYPSFAPNQPRLAGAAPMQAPYQNYQQASHYMYYPAPYAPQGQYNHGYAVQASQGQPMYGRRVSLTNTGIQRQITDFSHMDGNFAGAHVAPGNFSGDSAPYNAQFAPSPGK